MELLLAEIYFRIHFWLPNPPVEISVFAGYNDWVRWVKTLVSETLKQLS